MKKIAFVKQNILFRIFKKVWNIIRNAYRTILSPLTNWMIMTLIQTVSRSNLPDELKRYYVKYFNRLSLPIKWSIFKALKQKVPRHITDVLFVASNAKVDMLKDIIELKKCSDIHVTAMVTNWWNLERLYRKYSNEVIQYQGGEELIMHLDRMKVKTVVAERGDPLYCALTTAIMKNRCRIVYKPYDFVIREEGDSINHLAERYCISECSAIYHMHTEKLSKYLVNRFSLNKPIKAIRPQCVEEFMSGNNLPGTVLKSEDVHLVYAAGLARKSRNYQNHPAHLIDIFRIVANQGIHLHIYIAYRKGSDRDSLSHYFQLEHDSDYFHIHEALPYDELVREITKYDFGFPFFDMRQSGRLPEFHEAIGNNFFTYIEAGLPVICCSENIYLSQFTNLNSLGFSVSVDELSRLRSILDSKDIIALKTKVLLNRGCLKYERSKLYNLLLEE